MKWAKLVFLSGFTVFLLSGLAVMASAADMAVGEKVIFRKTADNFIIMYDSSSSMSHAYGATDMMEIAAEKQILKEMFATLPELDWRAGIYSFTPGWSLSYFKPLLSMRTYNKNEFSGAVDSLPDDPAGYTPLQGGLVGLGELLGTLSGKTVVFLFTDGQYSTQDGFPSPGKLAKSLAEKYDVCFQVIATGDTKENYQAIKDISSVNECSAFVDFSSLPGHPEKLTDVLFRVERIAAEKPVVKKEVVGYVAGKVLFDFDKSVIKDASKDVLINVSTYLKENPAKRVVLAGFTDSTGTDEYNVKLSKRRAESARAYLVDQMGIKPDRITLSWFGESDPVASNDTEAGRAENRRVTAIFTGM